MECEGDFSSEAVISVGAVRSKQTFGAASKARFVRLADIGHLFSLEFPDQKTCVSSIRYKTP